MKRVVVCGAGGFIGGHLVRRLKEDGYWVRGVDSKEHEFSPSPADEFVIADLRDSDECDRVVEGPIDEVYQLAADMGGMGFIHGFECELMRNNALINSNMIYAASRRGVQRYFLSSSVCVYRDMAVGEPELTEDDAYPAAPDNEYGWEKLYAERIAQAFGRRHGIAVRVARFQNCYGPEGTWRGGREKAPAALCRKVAEAQDGGVIEVWGDGTAVRSYIYVDDLTDGICKLMASDLSEPANIGSREYISVADLVAMIAEISGKRIRPSYVDGPVGVQSRNFANDRIESLGWRPAVSLREGLTRTYAWVEDQVVRTQLGSTGEGRPPPAQAAHRLSLG